MKKRGSEPDISTAASEEIFPVMIFVFGAHYDFYFSVRLEIYYSYNSAINGARELFFSEVNKKFRGGADLTGLSLEDIEKYSVDHFRELWGVDDDITPQAHAIPSPAFALILSVSLCHNSSPNLLHTIPGDIPNLTNFVHLLPSRISPTSSIARVSRKASTSDQRDILLTFAGAFTPKEQRELHSFFQFSAPIADAASTADEVLYTAVSCTLSKEYLKRSPKFRKETLHCVELDDLWTELLEENEGSAQEGAFQTPCCVFSQKGPYWSEAHRFTIDLARCRRQQRNPAEERETLHDPLAYATKILAACRSDQNCLLSTVPLDLASLLSPFYVSALKQRGQPEKNREQMVGKREPSSD